MHTTRLTVRLGWIIALIVIFWQASSPRSVIILSSFINDKLLHALAFFVLGMWMRIAWARYNQRMMLLGFLVFYGIAIECVQYFVPGRFFSIMDILMNFLGLSIAVLLTTDTFYLCYSLIELRQRICNQSRFQK